MIYRSFIVALCGAVLFGTVALANLIQGPTGGAGLSTTTFDSTNAKKGVALTSGNTVATSNGAAIEGSRSTSGRSTGKWCVKFTASTVHTTQPYFWMVSIQNSTYDPNTASNVPGYDVAGNGIGVQSNGHLLWNSADSGVGWTNLVDGDTNQLCLDADNHLMWRQKNAGSWNPGASGTPDPATGVSGVDVQSPLGGSGIGAAPYYFGFASAGDAGNIATLTAYGTLPTGYSDWLASP